ncbi:MAG: TIGR02647 family protein [Burkholderiales bacterium]|nr:TIGR02647 family protein [Burkholderiales bacterium]
MIFTPDLVAELEILARYDLSTIGEGIKVHKTAEPSVIAATQRLFDKGLISLTDGGYLTHLGLGAAEHVQALITVLKK